MMCMRQMKNGFAGLINLVSPFLQATLALIVCSKTGRFYGTRNVRPYDCRGISVLGHSIQKHPTYLCNVHKLKSPKTTPNNIYMLKRNAVNIYMLKYTRTESLYIKQIVDIAQKTC